MQLSLFVGGPVRFLASYSGGECSDLWISEASKGTLALKTTPLIEKGNICI